MRRILKLLPMLGIDPAKAIRSLKGLPSFFRDLRVLQRQMAATEHGFALGEHFPCLDDRFAESGSAKGHYFHQDLLVAKRIFLDNPATHVDVGSRIDGFVAHVASFRAIEVLDIRLLSNTIENIKFVQADLMSPVDPKLVDYCDSLSCLHALEHFGLGRYGDPVNCEGHLLGLNNLAAILRKGGKLYLSVPVGPQRIEFNAHRVFSISYLNKCFSGKFRLDRFSYVDDHGDLHENVPLTDISIRDNFGCTLGCGIFELTKT